MKKSAPILALLLLSFLFIQTPATGQGAWVEQPTGEESVSNHFLEGGDDCIGYAKKNSPFIYFFDVNIHKWTTVDLQSEQTFQRMEARGRVIMAYTDDYIIGYSSITSSYDTLRYEGSPLYPHTSDPKRRSYGCIDRAAYFVTYTHFYVFDGELGKWQQFLYPAHPYDDGAVRFMPGDDYIAMIVPDHNDPDNKAPNIAYSLVQHNAASIDNGGYLDQTWVTMSHGFITMIYDDENNALLTGYCSATNSFSQLVLEPEEGDITQGLWSFPDSYGGKTVMVFSQSKLKADGLVHQNFYGYYTTTGRWDAKYDAYYFKPNKESGFNVFLVGGSVAAAANLKYETEELGFYAYYGNNGTFHNPGADIVDGSGSGHSPQCANNIILAYDTNRVWIYNPYMTAAYFANGFFDVSTDFIIGDHFVGVNMWSRSDNVTDHDKLHIYNTASDKAKVIEPDAHHKTVYPLLTRDFFAFIAPGPDKREVWFYSGLLDSLSHVSYNMSSHAHYIDVKGRTAVAFSDNDLETFLYDANTGATTLLTTSFAGHLIGGNYFMFKTDDNTLRVYNFTKQEFSEIQLDNMGNFWAGDTVGLVTDKWENNYYAYNGYDDKWVSLTPEGNKTVSDQAFGKTAVVVREDHIYAFDPFLVSGIHETADPDAGSFKLFQNRPNPFTEQTQIAYSLTKPGYVSLKLYDMFGNELARLVEKNQQAGDYQILYNAAGLAGGVYYYSLCFNNRTKTKKMVVVR